MKTQSRGWLATSVAVVLLLGFVLMQLDNKSIYNTLQQRLSALGISLKAKEVHLSWMYLGSIRLDDVSINNPAFALKAQRLFIDLNLAALLTGTAEPKALYLQLADITIEDTSDGEWASLISTDDFKLHRIDISQSTLRFPEQKLLLEKLSLDIRDIGKNKNPRLEMQAHVGEGRLDAHGYLQLKRGQITRGFGRLSLYDVPLPMLAEQTTLQTLNGSLTAHLNLDETWQTFGHLSLQKDRKIEVELRGKLTGDKHQFFVIDNAILDVNKAGTMQIKGGCRTAEICQINVASKRMDIAPLLHIFKHEAMAKSFQTSALTKLNIDSALSDEVWSASGQWAWPKLNFSWLNDYDKQQHQVNLDKGSFVFSDLQRLADGQWHLAQSSVLSADGQTISLSLDKAQFAEDAWLLPLQFYDTNLWVPLAKMAAYAQGESPKLKGNGNISGKSILRFHQQQLVGIDMEIDAKQAEVVWESSKKPAGITLQVVGAATWPLVTTLEKDTANLEQNTFPVPTTAQLSLTLADAYASVLFDQDVWQFKNLDVNFDQFKEMGITLPTSLADWHGDLTGDISLNANDFSPKFAALDAIAFGMGTHNISGQIHHDGKLWETNHLLWEFDKTKAFISSTKTGDLDVDAEILSAEGLAYIQRLPFTLKGKLTSQTMVVPFGNLKDVSAHYISEPNHTTLEQFKCTFYEGSLRAKKLEITQNESTLNLKGAMQVGGIRLNNWTWLHKQFQTHLEGSVYATLNLDTDFEAFSQLKSWRGDGDVMIYNGKWLLDGKNAQADKISIALRKRNHFTSKFKIKHGRDKGTGHLLVDENLNTSGYFTWQGETYTISKTWPLIRYEQNPKP